MILFRLLSNGLFEKLDGCLGTGKESNIYHAKSRKANMNYGFIKEKEIIDANAEPITQYAVKIYKTRILVFKDRDNYVSE